MTWRLAQSLVVLRDQINAMYPNRDKRTDGALSGYTYGPGEVVVNGNNASSHNINSQGVVCAFDFTTGDYPGGISVADGMALAEAIRLELKVAPRGLDAYVIHHMEPPYVPYSGAWIADSGNNWEWVAYSGDPHTSHIHVSVDYDILPGQVPSGLCPYDMTDPWNLAGISTQSGTITPIQEDDMTPEESARLTNIEALARALYQQLLPGEPGVKDAGPVYLDIAAIRKAAETAADSLAFGVPGVRTAGPVAAQLANISGGLLSIAQGVGSLKSAPATPVPPLDVKALAAELAPLLTTNQAHQFIVALGQALPKQ